MLDAELTGDAAGGAFVVAGHQDRVQPGRTHRGDRVCGVGPQLVAQRDRAHDCPVGGHDDHGVPGDLQLVDAPGQRGQVNPVAGEEGGLTHDYPPPAHGGTHTRAGDRLEVLGLGNERTALLRGGHDGSRQRVLGGALGGRGQGQQRALATVDGLQVADGGAGLGEGAGLAGSRCR